MAASEQRDSIKGTTHYWEKTLRESIGDDVWIEDEPVDDHVALRERYGKDVYQALCEVPLDEIQLAPCVINPDYLISGDRFQPKHIRHREDPARPLAVMTRFFPYTPPELRGNSYWPLMRAELMLTRPEGIPGISELSLSGYPSFARAHEFLVRYAVNKGLPVPEKVLAEFEQTENGLRRRRLLTPQEWNAENECRCAEAFRVDYSRNYAPYTVRLIDGVLKGREHREHLIGLFADFGAECAMAILPGIAMRHGLALELSYQENGNNLIHPERLRIILKEDPDPDLCQYLDIYGVAEGAAAENMVGWNSPDAVRRTFASAEAFKEWAPRKMLLPVQLERLEAGTLNLWEPEHVLEQIADHPLRLNPNLIDSLVSLACTDPFERAPDQSRVALDCS